jgi:hypothetical protein
MQSWHLYKVKATRSRKTRQHHLGILVLDWFQALSRLSKPCVGSMCCLWHKAHSRTIAPTGLGVFVVGSWKIAGEL